MKGVYINRNVNHQNEQPPFVARAFYDDAALIGSEATGEWFILMTYDELREAYGSWLGRMRYLKEMRETISNRKKLTDDEP